MNEPEKILLFDKAADAFAYRKDRGTGGWIWMPDHGQVAIMPWTWTAGQICAYAKGDGRLHGCSA